MRMMKKILHNTLLLLLHSLHRQFLYSLKRRHLLLQHLEDGGVTAASLVTH